MILTILFGDEIGKIIECLNSISLFLKHDWFLGKSGIFKSSQFVDGSFGSFELFDITTGTQKGGSNIATTSMQIDYRLSPGNVTILSGETAMLACKIYKLGNKSVSSNIKNVGFN